MTSLYIHNQETGDIQYYSTDEVNISHILKEHKISYFHKRYSDIETLVETTKFQYGMVSHDLFRADEPRNMDPHVHENMEARFLLKGYGIFFVIVDGLIIELHVEPGDFILIPKNMIHGFESLVPITFIRFFSKECKTVPLYVTIN
ncbi:MAG: cupin domain-containing protein [Nitrososphaeraceae archaeon]